MREKERIRAAASPTSADERAIFGLCLPQGHPLMPLA